MVAGALMRRYQCESDVLIVTRRSKSLNLTKYDDMQSFFDEELPCVVIVAAWRPYGIYAISTYPPEFIYDNIAIASNCIHGAWRAGFRLLLFLGRSCIYRNAGFSTHAEMLPILLCAT